MTMMGESGGQEIAVKNIVSGLRRMEVWLREIHQALAYLDPEQTITVPLPRTAAGATLPVSGGNCPPPPPPDRDRDRDPKIGKRKKAGLKKAKAKTKK
jgi:hypothetical protein